MTRVRMPTGEVVDISEDATPAQLAELELYMSPSAQPPAAQAAPATPAAPQRSLLDQVGRSVGLAARMPLQAAGSTVGMVGDALNSGINMATGSHLGMPSRIIQQGIDAVLPVPENTGEKVGDFAGTMLAGGLRGGVDPVARGIAAKFAPTGLYDAPTAIPPAAQAVKDAQAANIAISPAEAGAGLPSRLLGMFAGKRGTNNALQEHNIDSINAIARQEAGLPAAASLDKGTLNRAIKESYNTGSEPIKQLGPIPVMPQYRPELANARKELAGQFEQQPIVDKFNEYSKIKAFSGQRALNSVQQLREEANAHFDSNAPGGQAIGTAYRKIADAIENNIENHLQNRAAKLNPEIANLDNSPSPAELLTNFRGERALRAKQHLVKDAINEGTGNINIAKFGTALNNEEPLTDGLAMLGRIANQAPYSTKMPTVGSPLSQAMPDIVRGGIGVGVGHLLGGPTGSLLAAALPTGRATARYLIPSRMGQALFAQPQTAAQPAAQGMRNAWPTAYNFGTGLFDDQSY